MQIDGISAIAIIVIASFAIDRIVTGLLFLLSMIKPWTRLFPDPGTITDTVAQHIAIKKHKLLYFVLSGFLAIVVLAGYGGIRIFTALGFKGEDPYFWILDTIVTGLVLVAGADRIAGFMKLAGGSGPEPSSAQPIEITGKLVLQEESKTKRQGTADSADDASA